MGGLLVNIGVVLVLVLVEGLFVAAEISLVSLRESQVRGLAESGRRGGGAVARLVGDPNRFLAAVQIGVTSTALLSSAFGAVTFSDEVSTALQHHGLEQRTRHRHRRRRGHAGHLLRHPRGR